jgi:hypothetical protein
VYRSTTANFVPSAATQVASGLSTPAFSDPGRTASTTYFYVIESTDGAGTAIVRAQATTPGGGGCTTAAPAVATLTAGALSSSSIALAWSAVAPPTGCSVTYSVYRSTTAGFTPSAATLIVSGLTTTSNTSVNLAASTTYQFVVLAVDAAGASAVTRANATTLAAPGGGGCHIGYTVVNSWSTGFQVQLSIQNTGAAATTGWTLSWTFPGAQQVSQLWNGTAVQSGSTVTVTNLSYNAAIQAGTSYNDVGFTGAGAGGTTVPTSFTLNGVVCN